MESDDFDASSKKMAIQFVSKMRHTELALIIRVHLTGGAASFCTIAFCFTIEVYDRPNIYMLVPRYVENGKRCRAKSILTLSKTINLILVLEVIHCEYFWVRHDLLSRKSLETREWGHPPPYLEPRSCAEFENSSSSTDHTILVNETSYQLQAERRTTCGVRVIIYVVVAQVECFFLSS